LASNDKNIAFGTYGLHTKPYNFYVNVWTKICTYFF